MNNLIYDQADHLMISPQQLDKLLAEGWRHFGRYFFRYNMNLHGDQICQVLPLRIRLEAFHLNKRLKKIYKNGQGFKTVIAPAHIDWLKEDLFERHKQKFEYGAPNSIYDFISFEPARIPCEALEVSVFDQNKLIAWSIFDLGEQAISSIYGMYDLAYGKYSLGIYTMLEELNYARTNHKLFYYHGYSYDQPSFYDYKKRFPGIEFYDWRGKWHPLNPS